MILVKAAVGALVRHPHTHQPLPQIDTADDPVIVEEDEIYWARLLRDGDVIRVAPETKGRASSSKGDKA
jgi:hypothetical protein